MGEKHTEVRAYSKLTTLGSDLTFKLNKVVAQLKEYQSIIIAYSGGIDSTLLAVLAQQCLGDKAIIVTAASPANARSETNFATELAQELGFNHQVIVTDELENPDFAANAGNRCYFCKSELFDKLDAIAERYNGIPYAYGLNADDMQDYRPGIKAGVDHGVLAPLKDAGLTKKEIVTLAQHMGIPNWDKPPQPCLSTRFPFGTPITLENLKRVEEAEEFLKSFGLKQFRLRAHDKIARLEIPVEDWPLVLKDEVRAIILQTLEKYGFPYVTLDLNGFESGSMNKGLGL